MEDDAAPPSRQANRRSGVIGRAAGSLSSALPGPPMVLFGSVAWGGLMGLAALGGMWWVNGLVIVSPLAVFALYFYGAALAFAPGLTLARLVASRRGRVARLALGILSMLVATHGATAGLYALQYRVFYAHWHASFPSVVWFFQLAFTSAGAVYVYVIDTLHLTWPFPLLAFLAFGLWFATSDSHAPH